MPRYAAFFASMNVGGNRLKMTDLRDALELGEEAGALAGLVSGSGPTLAFLASEPESALELQVSLAASGYRALHVHGPVPGARVVAG